jgi:hypothetical protein
MFCGLAASTTIDTLGITNAVMTSAVNAQVIGFISIITSQRLQINTCATR